MLIILKHFLGVYGIIINIEYKYMVNVMGIRVHKDIGFFIKKEVVSNILVDDYEEILEDFYTLSVENLESIKKEIENISLEFSEIDTIFPIYQINDLVEEKTAEISNFFKSIYNYDDFEGVLFLTPYLAKSSRFDDLIDYYEEVDNPIFKLNNLKQSLYPDNFYVCVKKPHLNDNALSFLEEERPKKKNVNVGSVLSKNILHYLMLNNGVSTNAESVNVWAYPEANEEKFFHPYVNVITYAFAKTTGILKDGVSFLEFTQCCEPSIVTHWG